MSIKEHFQSRWGSEGILLEADWCLAPSTRVLTTDFIWKACKDINKGDTLICFEESVRTHDGRKFEIGIVEKTKVLKKDCLRLITTEGELICSKDHLWMSSKKGCCPTDWIKAQDLKVGYKLCKVSEVWETEYNWETGWMAGMLDGEGYVAKKNGSLGIGQSKKYLKNLNLLSRVIAIFNKDLINCELSYAITSTEVVQVVPKGLRQSWQVVGKYQPVRLKQKLIEQIQGSSIRSKRNRKVEILSIEDIGEQDVIGIQTDKKTFLAEGLLSHNCGLEIAGWAFLTQDPKLLELLNSGRDMHRYVGSMVLGKPEEEITDAERKKLKQPNFTLIYGGTDYNLVTKDGLEPDFAKQVYDTFWALFPVARSWSDELMKTLDRNAFYTAEYSREGKKELWSFYQGVTGRKFYFRAYEQKISAFCAQNRIYTPRGFKYSEGMNYQVQSFSTADLHMLALGNLFRKAIHHRDKFLLINTVHDSVLCDIKLQYLDESVIIIQQAMEDVKTIFKDRFDLELNVPMTVECKVGSSWADLTKYEVPRCPEEISAMK